MSLEALQERVETLEATVAEQKDDLTGFENEAASSSKTNEMFWSIKRKNLEADVRSCEGIFKIVGYGWKVPDIGRPGM